VTCPSVSQLCCLSHSALPTVRWLLCYLLLYRNTLSPCPINRSESHTRLCCQCLKPSNTSYLTPDSYPRALQREVRWKWTRSFLSLIDYSLLQVIQTAIGMVEWVVTSLQAGTPRLSWGSARGNINLFFYFPPRPDWLLDAPRLLSNGQQWQFDLE